MVNPKARFIFALKSTLPRWQVLNHVYLSGKKYDKRLDGAELSIGAIFSRVDFTMLESLRDFLLFFAESFNCISARKVFSRFDDLISGFAQIQGRQKEVLYLYGKIK